jgi:hypothetical protein
MALAAAFKTSVLATNVLQLTTDGTYLQYPTGKSLDFAYSSIINGMQPAVPNEAPDPQVEAAVTAANKVLFQLNDDGTISTKRTKKYQAYCDNTLAYGQAVAAFATAYATAQSDPHQMAVWPVASRPYQEAVDQAKDDLISGGAQEIEAALDTRASKGNPIQAHMVAQAKQLYDEWNLGLAGAVPSAMPYSYVIPSGWADPDDKDGWTHLTVNASNYQHYDVVHASQQSQYSWLTKNSSTGGSGGVALGFAMIGGSGGSSSSHSGSQSSSSGQSSAAQMNTAKNLTISLWYALVQIQRPWLVSDLFYMDQWYLKGYQKGHISTGDIAGQAGKVDAQGKPTHMLMTIPQQMLLVKDVKISTSEWGSMAQTLKSQYGTSESSSDSQSSSESGGGGVSLGFISFGGSASHAESQSSGQGKSFTASNGSSYMGTTFNGETLEIPGAQIIAWLSDVVPYSPPLDDPEFGKTAQAAQASH